MRAARRGRSTTKGAAPSARSWAASWSTRSFH